MNKRFLKYFGGAALCLSAWLFYNSYSDQPNHSNVPPNALAVPFEQPLIIDPEKEQQFDFYFDKNQKENTHYRVRILMYIPDETDKVDGKDYKRYYNYIEHLVKEEGWFFDVSLDQYYPNENYPYRMILEGAVEIPKSTLSVIEKAPPKWYVSSDVQPMRFTVKDPSYYSGKNYGGKIYTEISLSVAAFEMKNRNGFYRLKIRPTRKLEDYPKMKFAIYIVKGYTPK